MLLRRLKSLKRKEVRKLQLCVLYEILTPKNETDISTFVKHMTREEFRVISHINKDSGATGAFENFIAIRSKKDQSIPKYTKIKPCHTCMIWGNILFKY